MEILNREDYFNARVGFRSNLSIPATVKQRLNERMRGEFQRSCFGVFYDMPSVPCHGQLFLHLLYKQDKEQNGEKLLFHLNNRVSEFGPKEFTLVTGLVFGPKPVIPDKSKFFKEHFRGKKQLVVKDIEDAFVTATEKRSKCDEQTRLKLGLLWILYGVLLMRDNTKHRIDTQFIHLIDDLEAFNRYPWGRVAYDVIVSDVRISMSPASIENRRDRPKTEGKQSRPQFDVCGFAYALQFWAYEVIPCVAKLCATRTSTTILPRMLRWRVEKGPNFDTLSQKCFPRFEAGDAIGKKFSVEPFMTPTGQEKKTPYYQSFIEWEKSKSSENVSPKSLKRRRSKDEEDKAAKTHTPKKKLRATEESSKQDQPVDDVSQWLVREVRRIRRTNKVIVASLKLIMDKLGIVVGTDEQEQSEEKNVEREVDEEMAGDDEVVDKMSEDEENPDAAGEVHTSFMELEKKGDEVMAGDDEAVHKMSEEEKNTDPAGEVHTPFMELEKKGVDGDNTVEEEEAVEGSNERSPNAGKLNLVGASIGNIELSANVPQVEKAVEGGEEAEISPMETEEGTDVGLYVGENVGESVGLKEHQIELGKNEGDSVLLKEPQVVVGENVGQDVGERVGLKEHEVDVGEHVGESVGESVGTKSDQPDDIPPSKDNEVDFSSDLEEGDDNSTKKDDETGNMEIILHKEGKSTGDDSELDVVKYDAFKMVSKDSAVKAFKKWFKISKKTGETMELSVENCGACDYKFFTVIWHKKGWLWERHIDAIFNLIILKANKWPKLFHNDWTTVDQFFWGFFTETTYNEWVKVKKQKKVWNWHLNAKLVEYVAGELPLHGVGKRWLDVEKIFGVAHVNNNHWVLYEIRPKEENIILYDSLMSKGKRPNPLTIAPFRKMAALMPTVVQDLLGYPPTVSKKRGKGQQAWEISCCCDGPTQTDDASCGILACKMLECLVFGTPLSMLNPDKDSVNEYRKSYSWSYLIKIISVFESCY